MKNTTDRLSIDDQIQKKETRKHTAASLLLNADLNDEEKVKKLTKMVLGVRDQFKGKQYAEKGGALFSDFLKKLQQELIDGNIETFEILYGMWEKIIKKQPITQQEIEIAQSLDLHHWREAILTGKKLINVNTFDLTKANVNFCTIVGGVRNSILDKLHNVEITGRGGIQNNSIKSGGIVYCKVSGSIEENRLYDCAEISRNEIHHGNINDNKMLRPEPGSIFYNKTNGGDISNNKTNGGGISFNDLSSKEGELKRLRTDAGINRNDLTGPNGSGDIYENICNTIRHNEPTTSAHRNKNHQGENVEGK